MGTRVYRTVGTVVCDRAGVVRFADTGARQWCRDEPVGRLLTQALAPDGAGTPPAAAAALGRWLAGVLEEGGPGSPHELGAGGTGDPPRALTATPLHDAAGAVSGCVVAFGERQDDPGSPCRQALQVTRTGAWEYDIITGEVRWSPEVAPLFGLAPGEFRGDLAQVRAAFHPDDVALWEEDVRACIEEGRPHHLEMRVVLRDGGERWLQAIGDTVRDGDGRPLRMVGIVRDVTDHKTVETALRASEAHNRRIVENSRDLIFINRDDRVHYINPAGVRLLKATGPEEVIGSSVYRLFHPDDHPAIRTRIARLRAAPGTVVPPIHERMVARDESLVDMEVTAISYAAEGGVEIQVTGHDITDRLRAIRELEARNDELARFNRAMVDREIVMVQLKQQVNALSRELGREPPYPLAFLREQDDPGAAGGGE